MANGRRQSGPTDRKTDMKLYGLTDEYATQDSMNINDYIDGLTEFILQCSTPMTISIQGDWGTGKTSIMRMVKARLDERSVETLWFNTWQYSQFNLGDNLAISLLLSLLEGLGDTEETKLVKRTIRAVTGKAADLIKALIEDKSNAYLGEEVTGLLKEWGDTDDSYEFNDPTKAIISLKEQFQAAVKKSLATKGKSKLVVFIDDLDRLRPEKAVELLEILKLFLDCENCIYMLAIDYDVVIRGVNAKYGDDLDKEKGEAFFDKIIQVPFSVPVVSYNISSYVRSCLASIGIEDASPSYFRNIERLILASIGRNPRAIKRIFNAYMLILKIAKASINEQEIKKVLLFAILCIQYEYEEAYNYLILMKNELSPDFWQALQEGDEELLEELEIPEDEREDFSEFVEAMFDCIREYSAAEAGEYSGGEFLTDKEMEMLIDVLGFSSMTANKVSDKQAAKDKRDFSTAPTGE